MAGMKRHRKLPIYIVEYHHDVIPHIYRNIGGKYLPINNVGILHFDSHPDLLIPKDMPAEYAYDKEKLCESQSIENWILPSCWNGILNRIVWIKPTWAKQIPNGLYNFVIGKDMQSKCLRVNCSEDYFVSECLYVPEEAMESVRPINLEVMSLDNAPHTPPVFEGKFILDIDLDYFSTNNPFKSIYSASNLYSKLEALYAFTPPVSRLQGEIMDATAKRVERLNGLHNLFSHLQQHRILPDRNGDSIDKELYEHVQRIRDDLLATYSDDEIDWLLVHDAGCTCDSSELPQHISTRDEIDRLVDQFRSFLLNGVKPTIVTISRSTVDDYTPEEDVDYIQEKVLNVLKEVYECGDVVFDYDCDEKNDLV